MVRRDDKGHAAATEGGKEEEGSQNLEIKTIFLFFLALSILFLYFPSQRSLFPAFSAAERCGVVPFPLSFLSTPTRRYAAPFLASDNASRRTGTWSRRAARPAERGKLLHGILHVGRTSHEQR